MMSSQKLAFDAADKALRLRMAQGISPMAAVCPFDVAETLGIEVRFAEIPTMEGMYAKGTNPLILISSDRPAGRQAASCAHELGHHIYGHGIRVDELTEDHGPTSLQSTEEFLANCFSGFFLMPKLAVSNGFVRRGWQAASCTPAQVYKVANWLGVGYTALITHMLVSLRILARTRADYLKKIKLADIRAEILGATATTGLIVADQFWDGRAIDAQVGDVILLPPGTQHEGTNTNLVAEYIRGARYQAVTPGVGRFHNNGLNWASFVRVSRRHFVGRSIYRHLEDPDDE